MLQDNLTAEFTDAKGQQTNRCRLLAYSPHYEDVSILQQALVQEFTQDQLEMVSVSSLDQYLQRPCTWARLILS